MQSRLNSCTNHRVFNRCSHVLQYESPTHIFPNRRGESMSTAAPVATNPEGQAPLSEGQRIIGTFISPYVTLADIKRNASWWAPWILISAVSLLFIFAVDKKIGWDQVVENKLASMSDKQKEKMEQARPEQRARQVK